ncbi:MAG: response regulator, partial [Planctomycetes bacterium]|nr:response regulator [Planctomycetota bacterium]
GLRVLLVEDNAVNRMVMHATLARLACVVTTAENGAIAVELVREHAFDAVLMDCQMPVMDGYEATGRIRALPEPANAVRVIALTANALAGDRTRCFEAGMNDYLTKPLVRTELVAALARCREPVQQTS